MKENMKARTMTDEQCRLITDNLHVAMIVAQEFYHPGEEDVQVLNDLYGECCQKMVEIVGKYDPNTDASFATFARVAMRNHLIDRYRHERCMKAAPYKMVDALHIDHIFITSKKSQHSDRRRVQQVVSGYYDDYFDEKIDVARLVEYCDEIDRYFETKTPGLPVKAFHLIYPRIVDPNIRINDMARRFGISAQEYSNAMKRIREYLKMSNMDRKIIEDCLILKDD